MDDRLAGLTTENISLAVELIRRARSVVVFTGAGVSAESGVPTYRSGSNGLWSRQNMERFANPAGYSANLPDSYEWYRARASGMAEVQPNRAHMAVARLAEFVPELTLVTQNIDSLHQRAGSRDVIELHGNLREFRCEGCGCHRPCTEVPVVAQCPDCGAMLRPCVVMFGEHLPAEALERARGAAARCDVLLSIGTSNQVWPAAELPLLTLRAGGSVVIVNPDLSEQPVHQRAVGIRMAAGEVMTRLVADIEGFGEPKAR